MDKRRKEDRGNYPSWRVLCSVMATLLILITGFFVAGFISSAERDIKELYATKANRSDLIEIKGDVKEIQRDVKTLLRQSR